MKSKEKPIFIIANCTWYMFNFRIELLEKLNKQGYKIILISAKDKYLEDISKFLFKFERLFLIRGSENPIFETITLLRIFFLFLKYRPPLVHNFTIKPCIYGSFIARFLRVKNVINHITGLGPSFFSTRTKIKLVNKILKPVYRYSFNNNNALNIFHNIYDRDTFIDRNFTTKKKTYIIPGSGVDTKHFKEKKVKKDFNKKVQILFPARILKEKGFIELIEVCNELWSENYEFTLNIAGGIDTHNKSSLNKKNLKKIINNKNINFIGKSNNMLAIYKKTDIVVLPSWREGLSKSLLESASMSLPIITTDVPGCNEIIKNGYSGILVPIRDKVNLKKAIKKFFQDPNLAFNYGINARNYVIEKFTLEKINNQILSIYDSLRN